MLLELIQGLCAVGVRVVVLVCSQYCDILFALSCELWQLVTKPGVVQEIKDVVGCWQVLMYHRQLSQLCEWWQNVLFGLFVLRLKELHHKLNLEVFWGFLLLPPEQFLNLFHQF